jgi:transmembrane sensor
MECHPDTRDLIASEAADWFVLLGGADVSAEDRTRFATWLRRSPEHVEEYLGIAGAWGDSRAAVAGYGSLETLLADADGDDGKVLALPAASTTVRSVARARGPWRWAGIAASVLAVAGAALWLAQYGTNERRYVTGDNEQIRISLQDGSVVYLNAHSRAEVRFSGRERRVELESGEARFHVAKDSRRPFRAVTAHTTVTAIGTVFNVARGRSADKVTVVEGKVEVRTAALNQKPAVAELGAGEEATVQSAGTLARRPAPDLDKVLSWSEHRLVFRDKRLGEVIEEFNRYNWPPIQIDSPALTALEISGAFRADDPQSLIAYLKRHESVDVTQRADGGITLQQKIKVPENPAPAPLNR